MSKKKTDPLAILNVAFSPLDKINHHLMEFNLTKQNPRHVIVSQLWMLQNRLEGEWDRLMLHQAPMFKKLKGLRNTGLKKIAYLQTSKPQPDTEPEPRVSKTG